MLSITVGFNLEDFFDLTIVKAPKSFTINIVILDQFICIVQVILREQLLDAVWRCQVFLLFLGNFHFQFFLLNLFGCENLNIHESHVFEVFAHFDIALKLWFDGIEVIVERQNISQLEGRHHIVLQVRRKLVKSGFVLDELTQDLPCCLNCDELEVSKSDLIFSLDHRVESCFMDWILELYL